MEREVWEDIQNFEGRYQISNLGRVKSLLTNKLLKFDMNNEGGYCRTTLRDSDGKRFKFLVHRLVAIHFIDNPDNKPMVNHIDNNPKNNHKSNLEWVTHSENMIHAQKQGRLFESQSKGGTVIGKQITETTIQRHLSFLDEVYGSMLIKSLTDKRATNGKMLLEIQCLHCNSIHYRTLDYLKTRKPSKCKNCKNANVKPI